MRITLTGEPKSTGTIYRSSCRGAFPTMYMTRQGKDIKEGYQWEARSQYKGKLLKKDIGMEVKLYFSTKRKQDIDNFNKIVYDALTGIIWEDDSQIQQVLTEKCYDKKKPRVELEIYEIL